MHYCCGIFAVHTQSKSNNTDTDNTGCGSGIPRVEFKPIWGQQVASTKHVVWTSAFWGFLLSKAGRSQ